MSEKFFPFKSVNRDRLAGVEDWRNYFASFIGNGVFPNPSNNLQVLAFSGMTVVLKAGKAFFNGMYYNLTSDVEIAVDTSEPTLNRIDDIILRFSDVDRKVQYIYRKGTPSANPSPLALTRGALTNEIRLATIKVNSGTTEIMQQNISDTRLDRLQCGIVQAIVDQVDTTTIFNQYTDWWESQTDTSGYMTVNSNYPTLQTHNKKVIGSINELSNRIDSIAIIGKIDSFAFGNSLLGPDDGWLWCLGQEVSRSKYSKLFSKIGVTYGSGNGNTTFNLPNLQDRFIYGSNPKRNSNPNLVDNLGYKAGEETHVQTEEELATHRHKVRLGWSNSKGSGLVSPSGSKSTNLQLDGETYTEYLGRAKPMNNMPPYIRMAYAIYVGI